MRRKTAVAGMVALAMSLVATTAEAAPAVVITSPAEGDTISRSASPQITVAGGVTFDEPEPTTRQFFLRRDACGGSAAQNLRLETESGTDGGNGCGYIPPGWNIFTEVSNVVPIGDFDHHYPTLAGEPNDGVPLTYDGTRPVTGTIVRRAISAAPGNQRPPSRSRGKRSAAVRRR